MIACVLCGQPAAPFKALLCESCDRERQRRIDRTAWFGSVNERMQEALQTMGALRRCAPRAGRDVPTH